MNYIECPACGKEKHHTVYCGIYKETICQAHCKGCHYRDDTTSLSHCNYRREMMKWNAKNAQIQAANMPEQTLPCSSDASIAHMEHCRQASSADCASINPADLRS